MLFPPSLITSCYGLALFSCPLVNKLSCLTVLFQGISQLPECAPMQAGQCCAFVLEE